MSAPVLRRVDTPLASPAATSGLFEVFRRRYLLKLLVRREISARYQGSFLGLFWSYLQPASRLSRYYFVFGILLARPIENFAIHLFAGLVIVHYFTETFSSGTRSIVRNKAVVQKMAVPREMFPVASMLVSLWHAVPQLVILVVACVITGWWGAGPLWVPDAVGMGAALLGFLIIMVYGTAFGLMFSCVNVIFRDFQRIVQTFITIIPFTVPMMYPYHLIADGERIPLKYHDLYVANPVAEAVMLIQRGFWYPTCAPGCAVDPGSGAPLPEFVSDLFPRGFVMLAVGLAILALGQFVFSRLEKTVPERL
jgi:ABC-2 type transport system permease protein